MQVDIKEAGSIPRSGRSPEGGHGNPLQYSCMKSSMARRGWGLQSIGSHRVRQNWSNSDALLVAWQIRYHWTIREALHMQSDQIRSVAQSCLTLCNCMNRSMLGLPVHHQLPEFTQTHGHRVSDAIQPSHPLSSPSPPAPNPSQHQSLFQWVNSSHEVATVLEFQLYHHSFQRNPRADLFQNGLVGSPCSPRDSQESSPTPQFKSINSSMLSFFL